VTTPAGRRHHRKENDTPINIDRDLASDVARAHELLVHISPDYRDEAIIELFAAVDGWG
jgi:hypothetical protein